MNKERSHPPLRRARLDWLGVGLALAYWVFESALHTWVFNRGTGFLSNLFPDNANELWMRGLLAALMVAFGLFGEYTLVRSRRLSRTIAEVIETGHDGFIAVDRGWRITRLNTLAKSLFEIHEIPSTGENFWDTLPEVASSFYKPLNACMSHGDCSNFTGFYPATNRWLEVTPSPTDDGLFIRFTDVTEQRRREATVKSNHERLQSILDNAGDGIITINRIGIIETFNHTAETIFGFTAEEVTGRNVSTLMPHEEAARHDDYIRSYLYTGVSKIIDVGPREVTGQRRDGSSFPMDLAVSRMRLDGETYFIGIVRDISEKKHAEAQLNFMSNYDPLTGLPNRSLLRDRLQHALHQAHRDQQLVAVLFLDLDRFKAINETLGHGVGDQLLKTVSLRLRESVREGDTVARLGGDEFVVVLEGIDHAENAGTVARKMLARLAEPCALEGREVVVTASIGIALYPHDDDNVDDLLRAADTAMSRAKEGGRDECQYFTADMTSRAVDSMQLEQDLRRALEREEFELYYQPQIDLASGRVIGLEALIRWNHPERGLVSPGQFIPLLEETGLILPVGDWVMQTAARQSRAWQLQGLGPYRVAVNLSALQFRQNDLIDKVERAIAESGIEPQQLELEITEGLLVENVESTIGTLGNLHRMGLHLSIDDFGTGYSSLNYLKRFPLHTLKIDQSFVRDVTTDGDSAAIARAIIGLATSLRLKVIAEGVETPEQLAFMRDHGCHEIQGYLFCRPLPVEHITDWLHANGEDATGTLGR